MEHQSTLSSSAVQELRWPAWALDWLMENEQVDMVNLLTGDSVLPDQVAAAVTFKDWQGVSLLNLAASYGDDAFARYLVGQVPASMLNNTEEWHGYSPLHEAAWRGYSRTVQVLLSARASTSLLDDRQQSALHMACLQGCTDCAKLLLEASTAEVDLQDLDGVTPLHWAQQALSSGSKELAVLLLEQAQDSTALGAPDRSGKTILHDAAILGYLDVVELLVEKVGCSDLIEVPSSNGETVLHQAAKFGRCSVVEFLLEKATVRANVNAVSDDGETALMMASEPMLCVSEASAMKTLRILERASARASASGPAMAAAACAA